MEAITVIDKSFDLNTGHKLPAFGCGIFSFKPLQDIVQSIDAALAAGVRLFDISPVFGNDAHVGRAFQTLLPKYNLEREDVFITLKLCPNDADFNADNNIRKYVDNLRTEYIDLCLINFSLRWKNKQYTLDTSISTWSALSKLYYDGYVNGIGVCNYNQAQLKDLMHYSPSVTPAVNQVEWHPLYYNKEVLKYCTDNDIIVQGYGDITGSSLDDQSLLGDPKVMQIANKLKVTPAVLLHSWAYQEDIPIVPNVHSLKNRDQGINFDLKISNSCLVALNKLNE